MMHIFNRSGELLDETENEKDLLDHFTTFLLARRIGMDLFFAIDFDKCTIRAFRIEVTSTIAWEK